MTFFFFFSQRGGSLSFLSGRRRREPQQAMGAITGTVVLLLAGSVAAADTAWHKRDEAEKDCEWARTGAARRRRRAAEAAAAGRSTYLDGLGRSDARPRSAGRRDKAVLASGRSKLVLARGRSKLVAAVSTRPHLQVSKHTPKRCDVVGEDGTRAKTACAHNQCRRGGLVVAAVALDGPSGTMGRGTVTSRPLAKTAAAPPRTATSAEALRRRRASLSPLFIDAAAPRRRPAFASTPRLGAKHDTLQARTPAPRAW